MKRLISILLYRPGAMAILCVLAALSLKAQAADPQKGLPAQATFGSGNILYWLSFESSYLFRFDVAQWKALEPFSLRGVPLQMHLREDPEQLILGYANGEITTISFDSETPEEEILFETPDGLRGIGVHPLGLLVVSNKSSIIIGGSVPYYFLDWEGKVLNSSQTKATSRWDWCADMGAFVTNNGQDGCRLVSFDEELYQLQDVVSISGFGELLAISSGELALYSSGQIIDLRSGERLTRIKSKFIFDATPFGDGFLFSSPITQINGSLEVVKTTPFPSRAEALFFTPWGHLSLFSDKNYIGIQLRDPENLEVVRSWGIGEIPEVLGVSPDVVLERNPSEDWEEVAEIVGIDVPLPEGIRITTPPSSFYVEGTTLYSNYLYYPGNISTHVAIQMQSGSGYERSLHVEFDVDDVDLPVHFRPIEPSQQFTTYTAVSGTVIDEVIARDSDTFGEVTMELIDDDAGRFILAPPHLVLARALTEPGHYTARLRATSPDGSVADKSFTLEVLPPPPTATPEDPDADGIRTSLENYFGENPYLAGSLPVTISLGQDQWVVRFPRVKQRERDAVLQWSSDLQAWTDVIASGETEVPYSETIDHIRISVPSTVGPVYFRFKLK